VTGPMAAPQNPRPRSPGGQGSPWASGARLSLVFLLGIAGVHPAQADLGRTVASGPAGPFRVNVIAFPPSLGVGESTWSVLVRDRATGKLRTDVTVEFDRAPGTAGKAEAPAGTPVPASTPTPTQTPKPIPAQPGAHPGFYSTRVLLSEAGNWWGQIRVRSPEEEEASFDFGFEVGPAKDPWREHRGATFSPLVALMLFAWHQKRVWGTDRFSREREDLRAYFLHFGEVECPQLDGAIYAELSRVVASDDDLLALAAMAPPTQPPANLLFAAVHALLLGGEVHPLADWYPLLAESGSRANPVQTIARPFTEFCRLHRARLTALIQTRLTQTNVVQRCSGLLPALTTVFERGGGQPLSLIEIGASAGLNLQWDRYFYRYFCRDEGRGLWGNPESPVVVDCELRGDHELPTLEERIPVAWRRGIDLRPVNISDPDEVLWLRALIWPDHPGRQERLGAALSMAQANPPRVIEGEASETLPGLMDAAPTDSLLCVYGTHTLYQFPRAAGNAIPIPSPARPLSQYRGDRDGLLRVALD